MTVKTWQCNICGDPYIGEGKPTHCPFCGAEDKYIVPAEDYKEPEVGNLTEVSKNNIISAIKLEVRNAEQYFCASNHAEDVELKARFHALGKVEAEHASLLSKMIGAQKPVIKRDIGSCPDHDDNALNQGALKRETTAITSYDRFLEQAKELRVKQVFAALIEVEKTHLDLANSKN